jgi:hypothetical protein
MSRVRVGRLVAMLALVAPVYATIGDVVVGTPLAWATSCSSYLKTGYRVGYTNATWTGSQPETVSGVAAWLNNPGGDGLCQGDNNSGTNWVAAWTLVGGKNSTGWSQSGLRYGYGMPCVERWFQQAKTGNNDWVDTFMGCADSNDEYWSYIAPNGGGHKAQSNISSPQTTWTVNSSWDPVASWTTPYWAEYASESDYAVNTVPGTASNPEDYTTLQVYKYLNGPWGSTCGNQNLGQSNPTPAIWKQLALACNHFHTWTS